MQLPPPSAHPLTLKPPQASNLLGGPAPGPPFTSSLDNHLPLVLPGLSGGQRPVFILYDKEEASDVEISLESDSDDGVLIVPQRMLMLESQDGTSAAATLPGSSLAPGGVTLPMPCPRGDISLPLSNDLPSTSLPHLPSSTPNYTVNLFPPAPLVSLVPPLNSTGVAQLGEPSVGLGVGTDSLPGAQLQQMLLQGQPPAPGQPTALDLPIQVQKSLNFHLNVLSLNFTCVSFIF